MATLTAEEIANQLNETDLRVLQIVVEDFSSAIEFSEKWIHAAQTGQQGLDCHDPLRKLVSLAVIVRVAKSRKATRDDKRPEDQNDSDNYYYLPDENLASSILKHTCSRAR